MIRLSVSTEAGTPVRERSVKFVLRNYDANQWGNAQPVAWQGEVAEGNPLQLTMTANNEPQFEVETDPNGEAVVRVEIEIGPNGVPQPPGSALQGIDIAVLPSTEANGVLATYKGCDMGTTAPGQQCSLDRVAAHETELPLRYFIVYFPFCILFKIFFNRSKSLPFSSSLLFLFFSFCSFFLFFSFFLSFFFFCFFPTAVFKTRPL